MLLLLVSWCLIAWISIVFGMAGLKISGHLLREKSWNPVQLSPDFVILAGFLWISALTAAISLISPIHIWVQLFFLLLGGIGTIWLMADLRMVLGAILQNWKESRTGFKLALIAAFGTSALAAFIDIGESDTWFYHTQSIQWIKEYAAVPGLGNIHGRFAFNSHFFVALALFSSFFSEEQLIYPLLSFFYLVFLIRLLTNIRDAQQHQNWFLLTINFLVLVLFSYQVCNQISGTGTDEMSAILLLYVFLIFIDIANRQDESSYRLTILWTTLFSAITFKLSAIFMVALVPFLLPRMLEKRKIFFFTGIAAFILLPFIGRNIVLSGYLFYPLPEIDVLSVNWKIPLQDVIIEKELVEGWAKQPEGMTDSIGFKEIPLILQLPFDEWFRIWWPAQSLRWKGMMLLSLLCIVPMFRSLIRKDYALLAVYSTLLVNLSFWFFEAPEPRFAYSFLFLGTALVLADLATPVLRIAKPGPWILSAIASFLLLLAVFRKDMRYFATWDASYWICPKYDISIQTKTYEAVNFTLFVPGPSAPAKNYFCHNAPLPCTPFPKANLELRGKSFQEGFKINPALSSDSMPVETK